MKNWQWFLWKLGKIRVEYPYYKVAVLCISASEKKVQERLEKRFREEKRLVPKDASLQASYAVEDARKHLQSQVDLFAVINNEEETDLEEFLQKGGEFIQNLRRKG